jgi:hypothetical protein
VVRAPLCQKTADQMDRPQAGGLYLGN